MRAGAAAEVGLLCALVSGAHASRAADAFVLRACAFACVNLQVHTTGRVVMRTFDTACPARHPAAEQTMQLNLVQDGGPRARRWAALAAAFAIVGCGGGESGNAAPPATSAPTPAPAPAPAPTPSPAPAPGPAPSPSPSPSPSPAPAPGPAPAPNPQLQRGATLYKANCSGCHGDDPESGTQGIYKGVSADVLVAAYRRVDAMRLFGMMLSTADNTDLAAFIRSRVAP